MHTAAISLALVVVPPCWLLPIQRRRGFPQERPSHYRERLHPGWPHGHNQWCGTAAPERFSKSSTSLVPDPNPQSCRERAEESSESTRAVLEKRSPTGEGRRARVALGQPGRGNAKHRVGAAFASRKAQLVNEVGSGTPTPRTVDEGNTAPVPLGSGQPSRQGSTEQLCQASAWHAAGNLFFLYPTLPTKLPEAASQRKSFVPKCEGFNHQSTLFISEFLLMKELVTRYAAKSFILGDSKHYVIPHDLTNYFWTYTKFSIPS